MKFLTSSWMVILLGALTYLGTTAVLVIKAKDQIVPKPVVTTDVDDDGPKPVAVTRGPSWEFVNPDLDEMVAELKQQKQDMEAERKTLLELSQRIQTERQELIQITQQVHRIQKEIDLSIIRVRDDEGGNLKRLAKTYSGMTPEGAATVMKGLDDVSLVKVLLYMKETEAAPILEGIGRKGEADAKRMALISERLRLAQMNRTKPAPASP